MKLKDLARELYGDTAEDIDGSEVARMWRKDPEKVVAHCMMDVKRVQRLHQMMRVALGQ